MANENMDEWRMAPGVVEETIAAAKKFLEEHPESIPDRRRGYKIIGAETITIFLGWKKYPRRAIDALASLLDHERGAISKEASHALPSLHAERSFARTVKSLSKSQPVPAEVQVT